MTLQHVTMAVYHLFINLQNSKVTDSLLQQKKKSDGNESFQCRVNLEFRFFKVMAKGCQAFQFMEASIVS